MQKVLFQNAISILGEVHCLEIHKCKWGHYFKCQYNSMQIILIGHNLCDILFLVFSFEETIILKRQSKGINGYLILESKSSRRVILPHSGFCYYITLTPYWNLRYKSIQEHVISLLSIIVVLHLLCISDLYLTLTVCLDTKTSLKPQFASVS